MDAILATDQPHAQKGPRWRWIEAEIDREIKEGSLAPGSKLPTEEELARRFNVHRHTIRRAIERLKDKDIVWAEQGRGIFVREKTITYRVSRNSRLTDTVRDMGRTASYQFMTSMRVDASRRAARALALPIGHSLQRVDLLRVLDDRVLSIIVLFFPLPRFDGIEDIVQETGSRTATMTRFGINGTSIKSIRVSAVSPTAREAKLLDINRSTPLLEVQGIQVDPSGIPVQFNQSRHIGKLYNLLMEF